MMNRQWGVPLLLLLVTGCVSVPPTKHIDNDGAAALRGKTVASTTRPRADFVAMTAGKATFALVGALAMISAGNAIVKENGIEDPVPHMAQELLKDAQERYGLVTAANPLVTIDTHDIAKMAHAASGADLLIDVEPLGSSFNYQPLDWTHYSVMSRYLVRVIDVRQAKLMANGSCFETTQKDKTLPTRDELLADKAARLKAILEAQRDHCLAQFKLSVLNIGG